MMFLLKISHQSLKPGDQCGDDCKSCTISTGGNLDCFDCKKGFKLLHRKCIPCRLKGCGKCEEFLNLCQSCNIGYYNNSQIGTGGYTFVTKCSKCIEGCEVCKNSIICEKCEKHYVLNEDGECDKSQFMKVLEILAILFSLAFLVVLGYFVYAFFVKKHKTGENRIEENRSLTSQKKPIEKVKESQKSEIEEESVMISRISAITPRNLDSFEKFKRVGSVKHSRKFQSGENHNVSVMGNMSKSTAFGVRNPNRVQSYRNHDKPKELKKSSFSKLTSIARDKKEKDEKVEGRSRKSSSFSKLADNKQKNKEEKKKVVMKVKRPPKAGFFKSLKKRGTIFGRGILDLVRVSEENEKKIKKQQLKKNSNNNSRRSVINVKSIADEDIKIDKSPDWGYKPGGDKSNTPKKQTAEFKFIKKSSMKSKKDSVGLVEKNSIKGSRRENRNSKKSNFSKKEKKSVSKFCRSRKSSNTNKKNILLIPGIGSESDHKIDLKKKLPKTPEKSKFSNYNTPMSKKSKSRKKKKNPLKEFLKKRPSLIKPSMDEIGMKGKSFTTKARHKPKKSSILENIKKSEKNERNKSAPTKKDHCDKSPNFGDLGNATSILHFSKSQKSQRNSEEDIKVEIGKFIPIGKDKVFLDQKSRSLINITKGKNKIIQKLGMENIPQDAPSRRGINTNEYESMNQQKKSKKKKFTKRYSIFQQKLEIQKLRPKTVEFGSSSGKNSPRKRKSSLGDRSGKISQNKKSRFAR